MFLEIVFALSYLLLQIFYETVKWGVQIVIFSMKMKNYEIHF